MSYGSSKGYVMLQDIDERLRVEGCYEVEDVNEKLENLWNCLQRSDELSKTLTGQVGKLREKHQKEISEMIMQVEKLRSITEDQSTLISLLRDENKHLKKQQYAEIFQDANEKFDVEEEIDQLLITDGMVEVMGQSLKERFSRLAFRFTEYKNLVKKFEEDKYNLQQHHGSSNENRKKIALVEDISGAENKDKAQALEKLKMEKVLIQKERTLREAQMAISNLQRNLENKTMSYKNELNEIKKSYEDAFQKSINEIEKEQRETNRKVYDTRRLEIDNQMLQLEIEKLETESLKSQKMLDEAETAKRELQDEVSELRCLKEQIAAELATTTKEAAESKDSFLRDRSLMEASYLEKIDELTSEKDAMHERIFQQEEKLKQHLEQERKFELKLAPLLLQLHSKEQEIVNQNKLLQEKEIKVVDMNAQISDIVKETNELRRTVAFQERKSHDAMKKNSELTKRCNDLQSLLKVTEDNKADISKKLINVSGELASSNEHVSQLKEDVHSLTLQVKRDQNGSAKEQERLQRAILQLSEDLRKEKEKQLTKSRDFEEFIEEIGNENTELKKTVDTLKSKIKNLSQRVTTMSADENSLQRKLEEELSSKSQLENKVKLLEETIENEKLTTSELSETLKAADQIKSNYEKEKSLQFRMMKESENMLQKKEAEIKCMKTFIKQLRMNLQNNEVKNSEHQKESLDLKEKLKYLTQQLDVLPKMRKELSLKYEEVNELNKYLAECNESRKLQSGVIIELQKQLCLQESRDKKQQKELEVLHKDAYLKDEKIFDLKRRNQKSVKEHEDVDNVTKALAMQLQSLQDENERLEMKLESVQELLNKEQLKNKEHASANHSEKHINRGKCGNDRLALELQVNQLRNSLMITQGRLQKEVEWRMKTENELRTVRKAKTELQSQLSHLEEDISNKFIEYRKVLIKVEHLEKENSFLRLEVENQSKQILTQLKEDS